MLTENIVQLASELAPIGLLVCDDDGKIVWANQRVQAWFGYELDEMLQQPVEMLVPAGKNDDHTSHRARYMSQPVSRAMGENKKLLGRRKDDSLFSVDVSLEPFEYDSQQFVLASIASKKDRRQADSERHIDLTAMNSRLAEAERLAAVGQMMKGLAHETHNSLQRAIGSLDLLDLDLPPDSELQESSRRIRSALEDLHHTYREVERYASPIHVQRKETFLDSIILDAFNSLAGETNASIEFHGKAGAVHIDPAQFRILFENLIQNAIDAAVGPAKLCVLLRRLTVDGKTVVQVELEDASGGVPKDSLKKITEPFYTANQKGTGLGLATCKRIVEAHEGTLVLKNQGHGLAVLVTIPG